MNASSKLKWEVFPTPVWGYLNILLLPYLLSYLKHFRALKETHIKEGNCSSSGRQCKQQCNCHWWTYTTCRVCLIRPWWEHLRQDKSQVQGYELSVTPLAQGQPPRENQLQAFPFKSQKIDREAQVDLSDHATQGPHLELSKHTSTTQGPHRELPNHTSTTKGPHREQSIHTSRKLVWTTALGHNWDWAPMVPEGESRTSIWRSFNLTVCDAHSATLPVLPKPPPSGLMWGPHDLCDVGSRITGFTGDSTRSVGSSRSWRDTAC